MSIFQSKRRILKHTDTLYELKPTTSREKRMIFPFKLICVLDWFGVNCCVAFQLTLSNSAWTYRLAHISNGSGVMVDFLHRIGAYLSQIKCDQPNPERNKTKYSLFAHVKICIRFDNLTANIFEVRKDKEQIEPHREKERQSKVESVSEIFDWALYWIKLAKRLRFSTLY